MTSSNSSELDDNNSQKAFVDYFRCPWQFARFRVLREPTSRGFFRFGPANCFGNVSGAVSMRSPGTLLADALPFVKSSDSGEVLFPFDPSEIPNNLRLEKYFATRRRDLLLHGLYYSLRPALPLSFRRQLQRWISRSRCTNDFPAWPVDCSVESFFEQLMLQTLKTGAAERVPFIWFWPDGNESALMMTHDVETQSGADRCDFLMDVDASYDINAAFQLIPEGAYNNYDELVSRVRKRGFEVNIHDLDHDGRLYERKDLFKQRARKINAYARQHAALGFRAGSMHRNQEWFDLLEFQYDMSVPTVSYLEPQNGGCCTVTPYFVGDLLELPLTTIQDHGLFYILSDSSIELWTQQMEIILAHHGLISFIVHPDYITESAEYQQYCRLLDYISHLRNSRSIWVALPSEINRWWRDRSNMELVLDGDSWKVCGRGSERARVAFASAVNGELRYQLADREERSTHASGRESFVLKVELANGSKGNA